jgi:glycosyltransferase involved in cell wall biosynthesis
MFYKYMKTEKQKKIALIYDSIFPFAKGGAEKRFYEIGRRLSVMGFDVHLYGMKSWEGDDVIKFEGMTFHGICRNYPLYLKSGRRSIYQALMFGIASFRLWREPFDVVDCCGFPFFSLFPLRLITWTRRMPLYSTWHEAWGFSYWKQYLGILGLFGYAVEKVAVRLPDEILAASENTARGIREKLGRRNGIVIAPNGIDLEKIKGLSPSEMKSDVIFAGRLLPYKNVDVLIKAVAILKEKKPDLSLLIVGDGPEKDRLENLANALGLDDNIRFTGFFEKEEDVYSAMLASKVLVLPSVREGFGIVVLEANACGLPVITTSHPQNAAQDLIEDGVNGRLVALDEKLFAEAIALELSSRKESSLYRAYVHNQDWNAIVSKLSNEIYFKR